MTKGGPGAWSSASTLAASSSFLVMIGATTFGAALHFMPVVSRQWKQERAAMPLELLSPEQVSRCTVASYLCLGKNLRASIVMAVARASTSPSSPLHGLDLAPSWSLTQTLELLEMKPRGGKKLKVDLAWQAASANETAGERLSRFTLGCE